jgi:hypothetical protein
MSSAYLPSFLTATAERLQPGAAVVADGVAWRPPFEGAGFTSCVKPALRGGVSGRQSEGRGQREVLGTRPSPAFVASGQSTPVNPAALSGPGLSQARNLVLDLAGDAASVLDEQWKTREMAAIASAVVQAPEPAVAETPKSSEQLAALLAPAEVSSLTAPPAATGEPVAVPTERFATVAPRTASVDDALARLGTAQSRGTGSAALLREMIATLANRDSATMRALSPPPKPSNTTLTPTDLKRLTSQTKMPPPLPAGARSGASSKGMPKLPAASPPPLPEGARSGASSKGMPKLPAAGASPLPTKKR